MESRVMSQADSCRPLTAEVWVRSQVSLSEICGAQSGNVTGFSPSTSRFSLSVPFHQWSVLIHVTDAVWS